MLLDFRSLEEPRSSTPLDAVYGSKLHNFWLNNFVTGTGDWHDDVDPNATLRFGTSSTEPTTTTTLAGTTVLEVVSGAGANDTGESFAQPPVGAVAMQFGCIFNLATGNTGNDSETDFAVNVDGTHTIQVGGGWLDTSGENHYVFCWNSDFNPSELLEKQNVGAGYHRIVVDRRSNGDVRVYIDGVLFGTNTPATVIDVSKLDHHQIFTAGDTVAQGIAAAFVAYGTTDFALDTDALAADAVLQSLIGAYIFWDAVYPAVLPRRLHAIQEPQYALTPTSPERTAPLADVRWPDRVDRPALSVASQLAVTQISPKPERTAPLSDVRWPDAVSRPFLPAAQQLAVTSIPPQPEAKRPITDVEWPDFARGATYPTSEQPFVTGIAPRPERTAPMASVAWPDFVHRPSLAAASQLAATELAPRPERTAPLADARWPDFAPRVFLPTAAHPFVTGEQPAPERTTTIAIASFPDAVIRPWVPVTQQLAITELPTQPERTSTLAQPVFPDSYPARVYAQQMPFTMWPVPIVVTPLTQLQGGWTVFPDAVIRPTLAPASHQAFAEWPFPIGQGFLQPGWVWAPDTVLRPTFGVWLQLASNWMPPKPERTQDLADVRYPDTVYRPFLPATQQLAATELPPKPDRSSPLADVRWPDFVVRPFVPTPAQPFVTGEQPQPERTKQLAATYYPDTVPRPVVPAAVQFFVSEETPRPERTAPLAAVVFPDVVARPSLHASGHPEPIVLFQLPRPVPATDPVFPERAVRPFLATALHPDRTAIPPLDFSRPPPPTAYFKLEEFPSWVLRPYVPVSEQTFQGFYEPKPTTSAPDVEQTVAVITIAAMRVTGLPDQAEATTTVPMARVIGGPDQADCTITVPTSRVIVRGV